MSIPSLCKLLFSMIPPITTYLYIYLYKSNKLHYTTGKYKKQRRKKYFRNSLFLQILICKNSTQVFFSVYECHLTKKHFILCSEVTDIRFCKCSDIIMKVDRNRLKFAIRAQVQPSVSIHAAGLLGIDRTLTKSNVLHQSQRLK